MADDGDLTLFNAKFLEDSKEENCLEFAFFEWMIKKILELSSLI